MKKLFVLALFAIIYLTSSYGYTYVRSGWGPNATFSGGEDTNSNCVYYRLV